MDAVGGARTDDALLPRVRPSVPWLAATLVVLAAAAWLAGTLLERAAAGARGTLLVPYADADEFGVAFDHPVYGRVDRFTREYADTVTVQGPDTARETVYESTTTRYYRIVTMYVTRQAEYDFDGSREFAQERCVDGPTPGAAPDERPASGSRFREATVRGDPMFVCRQTFRDETGDGRTQWSWVARYRLDDETSVQVQLLTFGERLTSQQRRTVAGILESVRPA